MKTTLVTGASHGLGKWLALTFAANDYDVIISGRDAEALGYVERLALAYGVECEVIVGDIRWARPRLIAAAEKRNIDVLINNAGVYAHGCFQDMPSSDVLDIIEVNLIAPILLTQKIFPIMAARGSGLIININSKAGRVPNEMEAVYCASKHGLAGFARSFDVEASRSGVRVLNIYLGAMDTAMTANRPDHAKFIQPHEAAAAIFNACKEYPSLRINKIDIGRNIY